MVGTVKTKIGAVAVLAAALSGCGASAHVSVGAGTPSESKSDVERSVANAVAENKQDPPKVTCPGNLKAKVGTVMYCTSSTEDQGQLVPVKIQLIVTSVQGGHIDYHIQASTKPGSTFVPPTSDGGS